MHQTCIYCLLLASSELVDGARKVLLLRQKPAEPLEQWFCEIPVLDLG